MCWPSLSCTITTTVEPGVSKLFWKRKKVYYGQVVYYLADDLSGENEILGNIKCLLIPGCLISISLLTPGSTVLDGISISDNVDTNKSCRYYN